MQPLLVLNVVGLTPELIAAHAPNIRALGLRGALAPMSTVFPAVTCSAQASMLTGLDPSQHGVVGNGWRDPAGGEIQNWAQSNALISGEKLYETARKRNPDFRCAKLFWWFNQGAAVDWSVTPKPYYHANGFKTLDIYSNPTGFGERLKSELGPFPFFDFWGPKSGLPSSRWIAEATKSTLRNERPHLTLAYLPHLDYDHQRFGPHHERSTQAVRDIDGIVGELITFADEQKVNVVIVSEYGIQPVDQPVHINRELRRAGFLEVRNGPQGELLDPFASRAFAVAEHQAAHVYVHSKDDEAEVARLLENTAGIERVLNTDQQETWKVAHPRAGSLIAIAQQNAWFSYYYWLDDQRAPDFARTVDIHRKNGFDPCELFLDPELRWPKLHVARRLAAKLLGFRYLMDVIPLDATLVSGSHGRLPAQPEQGPVFVSSQPFGDQAGQAGQAPGGNPENGSVQIKSVTPRLLQLLGV